MNLRHLDSQIINHFTKYKEVLVLLGARQTGKTTILRRLFPNAVYLLVDNEPIRKILETFDLKTYQTIIPQDAEYVIIDEIHMVNDPGRVAKIIFDQRPEIKLIITGSSSFHIKNKTSESLAGRKIDYQLFPLTFSEYLYQQDIEKELNFDIWNNVFIKTKQAESTKKIHPFDIEAILENALIYGQYPAILKHPQDQRFLTNLIDSILFKDLIDLQLIDNRRLALQLLKLLAHQIGGLINYSELSNKLQADARTIKRYIDIFEQNFIVYRLYPYSNNARIEMTKTPKIYFYDNGIRNALINDFSTSSERSDTGALFENFIISEIFKANAYQYKGYDLNFWRDKQDSEVDLVLSKGKELVGIEIKLNKTNFSKSFKNKYPQAKYHNVTIDTFY